MNLPSLSCILCFEFAESFIMIELYVFLQTGAKIIIRGKGSVKEGKIGRKDGQPLPGEDEPLHAYVTANNPENVQTAVEKVVATVTVSYCMNWAAGVGRYFQS